MIMPIKGRKHVRPVVPPHQVDSRAQAHLDQLRLVLTLQHVGARFSRNAARPIPAQAA